MTTVHWIDQSFRMISCVVCTDEFDPAIRKSGVNIKAAVVNSLCKFAIGELELRRLVFITDRGSNMIVALRDEDHIDCAAHVLDTVLRNTLDSKNCPESIRLMIKAAKELVRYLKKTSLQNLMQKQVKQSCETCWNSTFLMLKSIDNAHGDIKKLFADYVPLQMSQVTAVDLDML